MIDTKINLCDQCIYKFAECQPDHIEFGNGVGNDNVIICSSYPWPIESLEEGSMSFDDLIRAGRDTDTMRLFARTDYESGRFGHTRMMLLVRVADKLDEAEAENAKLRKVVEGVETLFKATTDQEYQQAMLGLHNIYYAELDEEDTK